MKLCRREQKNLFGPAKYNIDKDTALPGKSGRTMVRLSEYGKLLRNKQVLKRMYQMSEKQFSRLVNDTALKISKNGGLTHDAALYQLLERRADALLVRAGVASTIMQARQMITHGHWLLNGVKHNIPSYHVKPGDELKVRKSLQNSPLYASATQKVQHIPFWITTNPTQMSITLNQLPANEEGKELPADLLKVIEFYARV
jgi:small subunit ribosomal protein S4